MRTVTWYISVSQPNLCGICGRESGIGTHFSGTGEGCNTQRRSTNAPYLFAYDRRYMILATEKKNLLNVKTGGVFSKMN